MPESHLRSNQSKFMGLEASHQFIYFLLHLPSHLPDDSNMQMG